jgi:hypothetical protein
MKNLYKLLLVLYLFMPVCVSCQSVTQMREDSLKKEIGYDIKHIKYIETYIDNNGVKHSNYFTRRGDTIALYDWKIDISIIKKIKEHILREFVIDEFTEAQGNAVLLLILDFKNEVYEIRVIRGITQGFNNELLRVINKIEKDLIFVYAADCKTPIVTPFAIRLNE